MLALLWKRAQASGGVIDSLAGTQMLITAEEAFADRVDAMVDQAENAVALRDAATGEQIGRAVRALDPTNVRAAAALAAVERLKKESASHEILRQVAPEGSSETEAKTPPAAPPVPAFPANPSAAAPLGTAGRSAARRFRHEVSPVDDGSRPAVDARGQWCRRRRRKIGAEDPDAGILALKRAESTVTTAADIEPQVREELLRRLRGTMQELRSIKERQTVVKVQNAERLAQVEARRKSLGADVDAGDGG